MLSLKDVKNFTPHAVRVFTTKDPNTHELICEFPTQDDTLRLIEEERRFKGSKLVLDGGNTEILLTPRPAYKGLSRELSPNIKAIIVSQLVAEYIVNHPNSVPRDMIVLAPATGPAHAVRDEHGAILGTTMLIPYQGLPFV